MMAADNSESRRIFCGGLRSASALHLNQDDLKRVSALCARSWLTVILADRNQIDHSTRFSSALPVEFDEVPARIRLVCCGLPNRNLGHGYGPFRGHRHKVETPFIFI